MGSVNDDDVRTAIERLAEGAGVPVHVARRAFVSAIEDDAASALSNRLRWEVILASIDRRQTEQEGAR